MPLVNNIMVLPISVGDIANTFGVTGDDIIAQAFSLHRVNPAAKYRPMEVPAVQGGSQVPITDAQRANAHWGYNWQQIAYYYTKTCFDNYIANGGEWPVVAPTTWSRIFDLVNYHHTIGWPWGINRTAIQTEARTVTIRLSYSASNYVVTLSEMGQASVPVKMLLRPVGSQDDPIIVDTLLTGAQLDSAQYGYLEIAVGQDIPDDTVYEGIFVCTTATEQDPAQECLYIPNTRFTFQRSSYFAAIRGQVISPYFAWSSRVLSAYLRMNNREANAVSATVSLRVELQDHTTVTTITDTASVPASSGSNFTLSTGYITQALDVDELYIALEYQYTYDSEAHTKYLNPYTNEILASETFYKLTDVFDYYNIPY